MIWSGLRLTVIGAPIDQVFLMKVYAGRATDTPDLKALWPLAGFASPDEAAAAFFEAYPTEVHDPHLREWIHEQVR